MYKHKVVPICKVCCADVTCIYREESKEQYAQCYNSSAIRNIPHGCVITKCDTCASSTKMDPDSIIEFSV